MEVIDLPTEKKSRRKAAAVEEDVPAKPRSRGAAKSASAAGEGKPKRAKPASRADSKPAPSCSKRRECRRRRIGAEKRRNGRSTSFPRLNRRLSLGVNYLRYKSWRFYY